MSILHIIQTGYTNLHFFSIYKAAIQDRNLKLRSSTTYCPNANNPLKKWHLRKKHLRFCSIHKPAFLDINFLRYFYHVIWVENHQNKVYLFVGQPVDKLVHQNTSIHLDISVKIQIHISAHLSVHQDISVHLIYFI